MFATLSFVRLARQILSRILKTVGVSPPPFLDPSPEEMLALESGDEEEEHQASWPLWLFFAVAIGGPYMIYRLLNSEVSVLDKAKKDKRRPVKARALWDFNPTSPRELGFKANDVLTIFPPQRQGQYPQGWVLAGLNEVQGLVPADYVRMQKPTDGTQPDANAGSADEAMSDAFSQIQPGQSGQTRQPPADMGQVFDQEQRTNVANTWAQDRQGFPPQPNRRSSIGGPGQSGQQMWWDDGEVPWPQQGSSPAAGNVRRQPREQGQQGVAQRPPQSVARPGNEDQLRPGGPPLVE